MSETISNMPVAGSAFLSDIVPVTQGSSGPSTGVSRTITVAKLLNSPGVVYAADAEWSGGVKADGVSDDTAAWAAALGFASVKGAWVIAPLGVSIVSSITIPSNVGIVGRSVESYTGAGSMILGSVISCSSAVTPGISMGSFSQLYNIQVDGNLAQPCVRVSSGVVQLSDVDCFGGAVGIDFNTLGSHSLAYNCRIHECVIGISNPINTQIAGCLISNCSNHGIALANGCNNNVISGCRVEYSTNDNLHIDGTGGSCNYNTVTGNHFDSAGRNNISMRRVANSAVSGNVLGRAARSVSGGLIGTSIDANFLLANASGITITGNSMWVGLSDGATGYMGPYYALWDDSSNGTSTVPLNIFSANILQAHNNVSIAPSPVLPINVNTTFNNLISNNVVMWV